MSQKTKELALSAIRTDGGTQPRAELNQQTVDEYAEALTAGAEMPPGGIVFDGTDYWLYGGFHRLAAHVKADRSKMAVLVTEGTIEDAQWLALAENQTHGMRRTNADKRAAAEMALKHFASFSDRALAEQCGVSQPFLSELRRQLITVITCPASPGLATVATQATETAETATSDHDQVATDATSNGDTRTGRDGKQYPAKKRDPLVCDRCYRGATVVDCKGCKELRDKAEAKKKAKAAAKRKANARKEMLDKAGNVVPDNCRDAFADTGLPDLVESLEQIEAMFRIEPWLDKAQKLTTHYGFILIEKFREHSFEALHQLQLAAAALRAGLPFGVCPKCQAVDSRNNGKTCKGCRGYGFVPETRYQELTSE